MDATGRTQEAAAVLCAGARAAARHGALPARWQLLTTLIRVHLRRGDPDAARHVGSEADEILDQLAASLEPQAAEQLRRRAQTQAVATPTAGELDTDAFDALTPRQLEVAALVARGLANREIAQELTISPQTAETHVKNILARLDLRSRTQIATWATERGLHELL